MVKGAVQSGTERRSNHNHTTPNVLVAHLEEGLEVIHLFSGRAVCRLYLPSPGLHADLNGDGIPDHVVAVGRCFDYIFVFFQKHFVVCIVLHG